MKLDNFIKDKLKETHGDIFEAYLAIYDFITQKMGEDKDLAFYKRLIENAKVIEDEPSMLRIPKDLKGPFQQEEFLKQNKVKNIKYPIDLFIFLLGDKWKFLILCKLLSGTKRFNELEKLIGNISAKVLTQQLRELETFGFISRKVYNQIPPKVEYSITDFGKTLVPTMKSMFDWAMTYGDEFSWLGTLDIDKNLQFPYEKKL